MSSTVDSEQPADNTGQQKGTTTWQLAEIPLEQRGKEPTADWHIQDLRGGRPPLFQWERHDTEDSGDFRLWDGDRVWDYLLQPLLIATASWLIGYMLWSACIEGRGPDGEYPDPVSFSELLRFVVWIEEKGLVPTYGTVLTYAAMSITALGLLAVLVDKRELQRKVRARSKDIEGGVKECIRVMPVTACETGEGRKWKVPLLGEGLRKRVKASTDQMPWTRDSVVFLNTLIRKAYRLTLYAMGVLILSAVLSSLKSWEGRYCLLDVLRVVIDSTASVPAPHEEQGLLVVLFCFFLVAGLAAIYDAFATEVRLDRALYAAEATLARWALVEAVLKNWRQSTKERMPVDIGNCVLVRKEEAEAVKSSISCWRQFLLGLFGGLALLAGIYLVYLMIHTPSFGLGRLLGWLEGFSIINGVFLYLPCFGFWFRHALMSANLYTLANAPEVKRTKPRGWLAVSVASTLIIGVAYVMTVLDLDVPGEDGSNQAMTLFVTVMVLSCAIHGLLLLLYSYRVQPPPHTATGTYCYALLRQDAFLKLEIQRRIEDSLKNLATECKSLQDEERKLKAEIPGADEGRVRSSGLSAPKGPQDSEITANQRTLGE